MEEARLRFDEHARIEPRLIELWHLCRRAAPPMPANDEDDDAFDVDLYDVDHLSADKPDDGWCAEDWFHRNVKPRFLPLVGWFRLEDPPALKGSNAYDEVYSALFCHALSRTCACCRGVELPRRRRA